MARRDGRISPREREFLASLSRSYSEGETAEHKACAPHRGVAGFERFCERHVRIQDKDTLAIIPLRWFVGQRVIAPDLVAGTWLWLLKGRQIGITWLIAAYCLWRVCYHQFMQISVVFQERRYAEAFVWRIKFMYLRLHPMFHKTITRNNEQLLRWDALENHGEVQALVGSPNTGRSITGDIVVVDEAAYVRGLAETVQAVVPMLSGTLDARRGQFIGLSSSSGPSGQFYDTWQETYGECGELLGDAQEVRTEDRAHLLAQSGTGPSGFKAVFLSWRARDGRTQAWYDQQDLILTKTGGPKATKREHPANPEEAFEFAAGRVYGGFTRAQGIGDIDIPTTADRYRAIDWGQTESPFVCLWIAYIPGPLGLLISSNCPNTQREMLAYRYDQDRPDQILKLDDHCPDCIRYAVVTYRLTKGLVYVYRELYLPDPVGRGETIGSLGTKMHECSGWRQDPDQRDAWVPGREAELYTGTVADRSWPLVYKSLNKMNLGIIGHRAILGSSGRPAKGKAASAPQRVDTGQQEVKEGIELVRLLIDGTIQLEQRIEVSRPAVAVRMLTQSSASLPAAVSLDSKALLALARRALRADEKRKGFDRKT